MPVQVSYPGVYVQEVPSGVRTIVGVSTSVAAFIGRAYKGPMNVPTQCLSFADFERSFSSRHAGCDLARSVQLFFQNGGTRCYVTRIAHGATRAEVILENEAGTAVLRARARSHGTVGDSIRMAVTYNGLQPESTFNLEVFRWETNSQGATIKTDAESFQNLTMEPGAARYAVDVVNQSSTVVELTDLGVAAAASGFSRSGRPIPSRTQTILRTRLMALIGSAASTNRFRINVDGNGFVDVDLSSIDFSVPPLNNVTNIDTNTAAAIQAAINAVLGGGSTVTASFQTGPTGPATQDHETTVLLRVASANGDVFIEPAGADDLAAPLMLGTAQGGLEVTRHSVRRPAATGMVFDAADLVSFAQRAQSAFNTLTVDGTAISLGTSLATSAVPGARMYQDGASPSVTGNSDGVREKMAILANAVNTERAADPSFGWTAQVWGSRLALIPAAGGDNSQGSVATSGGDGVNVGGDFTVNVRYYSVGPSGQGAFQVPAGAPASDGSAPTLAEYRGAFAVIDEQVDLFNLMLLPHDDDHTAATTASLWGPASSFCHQRRAFLLMDAPAWATTQAATHPQSGVNGLRVGLVKDHAALFYPRLLIRENGREVAVGPSGAIAGLMARIDGSRGVWKAPAGTEADLRGVVGLERHFSDNQNGVLNPRAINTLRLFPNGIVNWGARTMDGDDDFASEWKYIPVRRLALFMEESLYRGLKWVVFEPNDEPLWAQIRLNVGAFMHNLFRQGAFQGTKPKDAYFVKVDSETTTQNDRNLGMVNIWVGFAPLKPAEFVVLYLQQMAGQVQT